jgi:hypothetical protein
LKAHILVIGHAMRADEPRALEAVCDACLAKLIDIRVFLKTLAGLVKTFKGEPIA